MLPNNKLTLAEVTANANEVTQMTGELSRRDMLYNAVLRAVKEYGSELEVGIVRAVLNEVDGEIALLANRNSFKALYPQMSERKPRE